MALTLSLLRHAKSSWDDAGIDDRDRPLNKRGRNAAPDMGAWMKSNGVKPDLVLCSTSARTRETLDSVLPHWKPRPKVRYEEALYLAEPEAIVALIAATPKTVAHLMIVAHNPGLHDLALQLAGSANAEARGQLKHKFPTAGLAVLTFTAKSWDAIGPRKGRLVHFMAPRLLASAE